MHHINWTLSKKDKIIITATLLAYGTGYLLGGWSPVLNLLFLFFLLGVAQKTMKSGAIPTFRLGMLCAVVVAMLLVKTGLYYQSYVESYRTAAAKQSKQDSSAASSRSSNAQSRIARVPTPTPIPREFQWARLQDMAQPTITGSVKPLMRDLGLFKTEGKLEVQYYEAGSYTSGPYSGYTRIMALIQQRVMGEPIAHFFLTNDYSSFIFVDSSSPASGYSHEGMYQYLMFDAKPEKIMRGEGIESDLPDILIVNDTYALYKDSIVMEQNPEDLGIENEYDRRRIPKTSFSGYTRIDSRGSFLKLYAKPTEKLQSSPNSRYTNEEIAMHNNILRDSTGVIAVDATGLAYTYHLSRLMSVRARPDSDAIPKDRTSYVHGASYYLTIKQDELHTDEPLYSTYDNALPHYCATNPDLHIVSDMDENRLRKIGTTDDGVNAYVLKNSNDPLYHLQYVSKQEDQIYSKEADKYVDFPPFETYKKKTPLMFIKDPWERWILMAEFDWGRAYGCGKPVIYLYPESKQRVRLSFANRVSFETQIPAYRNGWDVTAYPDGTIQDEQPQYTSCDSPQMSGKGAEYAVKACTENKYPYIYWSGNTTGTYPDITDRGWFVKREELSGFMDKKLKEIGLNDREKKDMMDYWIPSMLAKQGNHFRISFLTTGEMNRMIPMNIYPLPDSVLRIFLDFEAYGSLPDEELKPQTFPPFVRNGFTVVEWGGLKK